LLDLPQLLCFAKQRCGRLQNFAKKEKGAKNKQKEKQKLQHTSYSATREPKCRQLILQVNILNVSITIN
jgi:hypothetical protein